jgi:hypothetical protein
MLFKSRKFNRNYIAFFNIVTHLTTIIFLYDKHHPEGGQITGWNMLVKILKIKMYHEIKVHLLIVDIFYIRICVAAL